PQARRLSVYVSICHRDSPGVLWRVDFAVRQRLFRRVLEQDRQLISPERRDGVAAVATRFVAEWKDHRTTVRNALNFPFENSKLWWIDQIVGGIDREQRRPNFFQVRTRIVIAGCFKG